MSIAKALLCASLALTLNAPAALAQNYPNRAITLVVPFVPGGSASVVPRVVADRMSEILGQPIVMDNRGGAGGMLATRAVARSAPDGYTILVATNATIGTAPALYPNPGYDPRKDFAPLGYIGEVPNAIMVQPSHPARSLPELIGLAKASGKAIEYGTPGIGSINHLAAELIAMQAGIKLAHVPYRGGVPALNDLLGGHIPIVFSAIPNVVGHIEARTLRALAMTSAKRSSLAPDVPTVAEQGFAGFDMTLVYGLVAPAGTPRNIVERLNSALNGALANEDVRKRLLSEGAEPRPITPEQHAADIARDESMYATLVKALGIKGE